MAQKIMLSLAVFFCWTFALKAEEYKLSSPDKKLEVKLRVEGRTEFEVWYDKVKLVEPSVIGMNLSDGRHVGGDPVTSVKKDRVNRKVDVVAGKNKTLKEAHNEIVLSYGTDYDLVVRAYNKGWAYRFVTHWDEEIIIDSEDAVFNFAFISRSATAIPHPSVNSRARCTRFIRATVISSGFTRCIVRRVRFRPAVFPFLRCSSSIPASPTRWW